MRLKAYLLLLLLVLAIGLAPAASVRAQQPGTAGMTPGGVTVQGEPYSPTEADPAVFSPPPLDYREEMRKLVQEIATFARKERREFQVLTQNGLELLVKQDPIEPDVEHPAVAYMRVLDGVIQAPLFHGIHEMNQPRQPKTLKRLMDLIEIGRKHELAMLMMDYADQPKVISESYRQGLKARLVPFVANAQGPAIAGLPRIPKAPITENPRSVLSMNDVRNFVYLRNSAPMGRQDEFAMTMHGTNFDLVVVDVFHHREPLTKQAVETLKYKNLGAKRLVFAYMDIGAAAAYRYYWQPHWREGSPLWIAAPHPEDADSYFVEYWRPEWKSIVTGGPDSYIYGIIKQGYDGVVLDGVETYRFFEGGMDAVMRALFEQEE